MDQGERVGRIVMHGIVRGLVCLFHMDGLNVVGSTWCGAGDGMGEGHLERAGSRWQARGGIGLEMAWARPISRWWARCGGLDVVWGGRWCG